MKPTITLIINTYNQADYLARVLRAVSRQRDLPDEVIIADDGSGGETRLVFQQWSAGQPFAARHIWQKNEGFRRSHILNAAIADSHSQYLVFLDGDTVPHPLFVSDHRALARSGFFLQGHRVCVQQRASVHFGAGDFFADRRRAFLAGQMRGLKHAFRWPTPCRRIMSSLAGVRGCNLSVWREDLAGINGYNQDYFGWGCEDLDLALRLMNFGIRRMDVRGRALCFHLWHPPLDRSFLAANEKTLDQTVAHKSTACERGLNLHLNNRPCAVWQQSNLPAQHGDAKTMAPALPSG